MIQTCTRKFCYTVPFMYGSLAVCRTWEFPLLILQVFSFCVFLVCQRYTVLLNRKACLFLPIGGSFQFGSPLSVIKVLSFWDIEFTGNEPDYISQDNASYSIVVCWEYAWGQQWTSGYSGQKWISRDFSLDQKYLRLHISYNSLGTRLKWWLYDSKNLQRINLQIIW